MKLTTFSPLISASMFALLLCQSSATAQTQWKEVTVNSSSEVGTAPSTFPIAGINSHPNAVTRDKQGNIYAALGRSVFKWNGQSWAELGSGQTALNANGEILTLLVDAAENVYATGWFTDKNNTYYVARWNGSTWSELGTGPTALSANGVIAGLTLDSKGNLYAAGSFYDQNLYYYVAEWNGTFWNRVGQEDVEREDHPISALACDSADNIYAAGNLADENVDLYVAKWNGTAWSELGTASDFSGSQITNLVVDKNSHVYAAGNFYDTNGLQYVAEWDGTHWLPVGNGDDAFEAHTLYLGTDQTLYAGGYFANPRSSFYLVSWNGSQWIKTGQPLSANFISITADNAGHFYAAGNFRNTLGNYYILQLTVSSGIWSETGSRSGALNTSTEILATTVDASGNLYAAGKFIDTLGKRYVAKWDGRVWTELGTGANALNANGDIDALAVDNAGNVYAAGDFTNGSQRRYVAKWNGTSWSELGGGTGGALFANYAILSIAVDKADNVYAGGFFANADNFTYVAKWNGSAWQELGSGDNRLKGNGGINAITLDQQGNVYAGGGFTKANGANYVATWNGTAWVEVGASSDAAILIDTIKTLTADSSGNIYAGGAFRTFNDIAYIAKWDKINWSILGGGMSSNVTYGQAIYSVKADKAGNIYAGGTLLNKNDGVVVEKWDGTKWGEAGDGVGDPVLGTINCLSVNPMTNTLYASGTFKNSRFLTYVEELEVGSVLAADDLHFTAALQSGSTVLNWFEDGNLQSSYYTIERSLDGRSFISIGKVTSSGSSSRSYSYQDQKVSTLGVSTLYYRLTQTDQGGRITMSDVIALHITGNQSSMVVSPNPVGNAIILHPAKNWQRARIKLTDANGKLLYATTHDLQGGSSFTIDASAFSHGVYFITVDTHDQHETLEVIK